MLKITVQKLGDASVLRCHGRIVAGGAGSILRKVVLSELHTKMIVIDLARDARTGSISAALKPARAWLPFSPLSKAAAGSPSRCENIWPTSCPVWLTHP